MKDAHGIEAVTHFVQNMDGEKGWWYYLTIPGRKQPLKEFRLLHYNQLYFEDEHLCLNKIIKSKFKLTFHN